MSATGSKNCVQCKQHFRPTRAIQIYCSRKCSSKASNDRKPRHPLSEQSRDCRICGCAFTPVSGGQRCCSPACSAIGDAEAGKLLQRRLAAKKRAAEPNTTCEECGKRFAKVEPNGRFCCKACGNRAKATIRSNALPLAIAMRNGDCQGVIEALRNRARTDENGCWRMIEGTSNRGGYTVVSIGGRQTALAHRVALEAKLGKPLGKMQAHHMCANRPCFNPDHLQIATARQNMGEMFERRFYRERIADLEAALAAVAPEHPLLAQVSITEGAVQ